jgi:hypothetical protein
MKKPEILRQEELEAKASISFSEDVLNLRNTIMAKDYFGEIYKKFQELNDFVTTEIKYLKILDDAEGYPKIMKVGAAYNDIDIYRELEKIFV